VTLQVEQLLAAHVAHLLHFHSMQTAQPRLEIVDAVHVASRVQSRGFVPVVPVELELFAHGHVL
jgi:hypothetical protein